MRKTFETPNPITVRVRFAAGELKMEATETAETVVDLEPQNDSAEGLMAEARVQMQDGGLVIEIPDRRGPFARSPEFDIRLRCPRLSSLRVLSASADVRCRGLLGALEAKTASGDVQANEVAGETVVTTASGDVELGECAGPVAAKATSGDVRIGKVGGRLQASLVSGDLCARAIDGGADLHTISGDVDLEAVGPGAVRVSAVSGDVEVGVRPGCDVWMDLSSTSGDTSSELEAADGPPADRANLVELTVHTVSGDVAVRRANAAVTPG